MKHDEEHLTTMAESIFRSATMQRYQFFLQNDAAYDCMSMLGDLGCIQFKDVSNVTFYSYLKACILNIYVQLNADINSFQRTFVNDVRRCDEMERKLRFLYCEVKKVGIPIAEDDTNPEAPQPKEFSNLEVCLNAKSRTFFLSRYL